RGSWYGCSHIGEREMPPDMQSDIMDWDYTTYSPHHFGVIWASPPCTEYSMAKTAGVREIEEANKISQQTQYWIIENPKNGKLKEQEFMAELPFKDVDYCKYGMPYRKRTRLWNLVECWGPRPLCQKDCDSMSDNRRRHKETAQRRPLDGREGRRFRREELYKVPESLISKIFRYIINHNNNPNQ
ncbi:MAG: hypothetical protein ACKPKO_05545, partial [Candidatus Fonsibacter sp.]